MTKRIDRAAAILMLAVLLGGAKQESGTCATGGEGSGPPPAVTGHFTDIRKAAGITFVQDSTQTEEKYYLETMGTGVGFLDYDQDGLMDLLLRPVGPDRCVQAGSSAAIGSLPQQWRWNLYRCDGQSRRGRRRPIRAGSRGRRLQQRRLSRLVCHRLRPCDPLSQ